MDFFEYDVGGDFEDDVGNEKDCVGDVVLIFYKV